VSGHVSPIHYLKPTPLRSRRITSVQRYYGRLRLPSASALSLAFLHLSEGARSSAPVLGSPWLLHNHRVRLDTVCDPGWSGTACPFNSSPCLLLPAGVLKPSAPSNNGLFGTTTFTVGFTRYHCASPAFLPTHQAAHYWTTCKAKYLARG